MPDAPLQVGDQLEAIYPDRRYVVWRWENRGGKPTKVPYVPGAGRKAASDAPGTWRTYEEACATLAKGHVDGIGYCLMKRDNFGALDLDHCRNPTNGDLEPWARDYIERAASYTEITPSGEGVRILGVADGSIPDLHFQLPRGSNGQKIEVFHRAIRYITLTGQRLDETQLRLNNISPILLELQAEKYGKSAANGGGPGDESAPSLDDLPDDIVDLIRNGAEPGARSELQFKCCAVMRRAGYTSDKIIATFRAYPQGIAARCFENGKDGLARHVGMCLKKIDDEAAAKRAASASSFFGGGGNGTAASSTAAADNEPRPPAFTDEALALHFATLHAPDLRYVAAWGKWLRWTGQVWKSDDTLAAFDMARVVCREAAAACNKEGLAKALASAKTVAAVERLAKADRRLAATTEQWDQDIWLLNTPDGVIDLRTGRRRQHRPEDYCTKITTVGPQGACPIFLQCLDRSMAGDAELIAFLQRLFGYALTGSIREHALAFFYGLGANGKGVILSTVAGVLGDYHKTAPIETFTATHADRHPTDMAMLRGARLVTATETEEGRRWAESRIKMLTGGDEISARFMRQDYFEYLPQFTLVISGNHKPGLRSVGEAIRRRFNLVPFAIIIPEAERDKELGEKLKAEWPGILAWMIEGCLVWQRQGLDPPAAIRAATDAYLESEDALAAWIDQCCIRNPNAWEPKAALYASWKKWADDSGEFAGSSKSFGQALEDRGFHPHRAAAGRGFYGLSLKPVAGWEKQWRAGW